MLRLQLAEEASRLTVGIAAVRTVEVFEQSGRRLLLYSFLSKLAWLRQGDALRQPQFLVALVKDVLLLFGVVVQFDALSRIDSQRLLRTELRLVSKLLGYA